MKRKGMIIVAFVIILIGLFRVGMVVGAQSAVPGTAGDPLITQSYLEQRLKEIKTSTVDDSSFVLVHISKGKNMYISEGTEFILYQGSATVIGKEGIVNLTSGEKFLQGNSTPKYSLLFSPSDQSGVKAISDLKLYIKGKYRVL